MKTTVREIKRRFFAMRNGVIADRIRSLGAPYKIIFGLTLPQVADIASAVPSSPRLARALWENSTTRESVMIAPMLFPAGEMDPGEALHWIETAPTTEAIDILCHRLLRHLPDAEKIALKAAGAEADMTRYAGLRLLINLFPSSATSVESVARQELESGCKLTASSARMILDEISYLNDGC